MAISSRAGWTLGLGVLGVAGLIRVSHGQGDGAVQKAAGTAPPAATRPAATVVGAIDLEAIFRGYEKTKFHMAGLQAESLAKEGQLRGIVAEAKQINKEMETFQPGTTDFKDRAAKLTQLQANLEALKKTAEREGQAKYAEIMATFYKEVQEMTVQVARYKGLTYVVRISNEAVNSQDPEGVMAAMARPVVYADPSTDITNMVVHNLNKRYLDAGGQVAKTPAPGTANAGEEAPAEAPANAPAPAPTRPAPSATRPSTARPASPK